MMLHSIGLVSTNPELVPADIAAAVEAGEAVYAAGRWVFGAELMTTDGRLPVSELRVFAGFDPRSGDPGDCDVNWLAAYRGGRLVKRAVCVDATGIMMKAQQTAGQIG